nr:hypothetical protein [Salinispora tropica]
MRSTSERRSAASSPQRRPENAATITSAANRGGIRPASASTWATVATGRSGV